MSQTKLPTLLALMLAAAFAGPVTAQDATTESPATEAGTTTEAPVTPPAEEGVPAEPPLSTGAVEGEAPTDGPGSVYVQSKHDSWELRCVKAEDGSDPCQLYQLLKDEKGNSVAEISMFTLPAGGEAVVGANVAVPLGTLLTEQLRLQVDAGKAKVYPFSWCDTIGCYARIGLTAEEVESFKKGAAAAVTIVPVGAPDQKVALAVSLKGFTAGYDALQATAKPE